MEVTGTHPQTSWTHKLRYLPLYVATKLKLSPMEHCGLDDCQDPIHMNSGGADSMHVRTSVAEQNISRKAKLKVCEAIRALLINAGIDHLTGMPDKTWAQHSASLNYHVA